MRMSRCLFVSTSRRSMRTSTSGPLRPLQYNMPHRFSLPEEMVSTPAGISHIGLLRDACRGNPDKVFLHGTTADGQSTSLTFQQLEDRSRRIAAGLLEHGMRRGERIAIAAPNNTEWLELFFRCSAHRRRNGDVERALPRKRTRLYDQPVGRPHRRVIGR